METTEKLTLPYLLMVNIPLYRDADGGFWGDALWVKDLRLHLSDIESLTLLCPIAPTCQPGWERLDDHALTIRTTLPRGRSWFWKWTTLYRDVSRLVDEAAIVHIGVAGWPYPLGWLASVANLRRKRFLVVVAESAPWRIPAGTRGSFRQRFKSRIFETMARWCISHANLLVATQPEYLKLARGKVPTFLNPASWIDASTVLDDTTAERAWGSKSQRLLYAGRLTEEKGVSLLLDAHRSLGDEAPELDIIGEGKLRDQCVEAASQSHGRLRMLPPVPYGEPFYRLLDDYRALLAPIQTDEQPRVIFDAFARAIPVIGSDSSGVASCITDGRTGWLHPASDVNALATLLRRAAAEPDQLRSMGMSALNEVRGRTHRQMHRVRIQAIKDCLQQKPLPEHTPGVAAEV